MALVAELDAAHVLLVVADFLVGEQGDEASGDDHVLHRLWNDVVAAAVGGEGLKKALDALLIWNSKLKKKSGHMWGYSL